MVESRSVRRNAKNVRGLGRDRAAGSLPFFPPPPPPFLSPPQRLPLGIPIKISIIEKIESARGTMGRGKRREPLFSLPPSHRAPRALFFFSPASPQHKEASAEERAPFPKSCTSYFRFARFNMFPLYYLRAWHRLGKTVE